MNREIKRESLTEQIKSILIQRIEEGTLAPGDRLKELQLADEFGTSQAPVREAIRSLQALGYVEHKLHVGSLVKTFSKREIEEAFQIRQALEGYCLMMPDRETEPLTRGLQTLLERMSRALPGGNVKEFTEADNGFHRTIIDHSQNLRMLEIWKSLKIQLQVIGTIAEAAMPLEELYALHLPIVTALEQGNRERAVRHLSSHYKEIGNYWKQHQ